MKYFFKDPKKNFHRITEFKDAILERSRILFSENKEGDKGRYGIKDYPESGNFFFVQYHGKKPSKKWKVSANLKEEIQEPIQQVTYSGKHEIEVEVKDMLRYYDKYALFGEIKGNGEKIHLLVEYDKDEGFTVEDIYTSCKLEDVFKNK